MRHLRRLPPRESVRTEWPEWVPDTVRDALGGIGITRPWPHQAEAATHAFEGRDVVVSTGTASGKSLAYLLPLLTEAAADGEGRTLYLAPTKALAADQARAVGEFEVPGLIPAIVDGDTPFEHRQWAQRFANLILSNPDLLHHSLLPRHRMWRSLLKNLKYVVVDECHVYRGVFGAHVSHILRRLRRVCALYGSEPTFVLASATVAEPELAGERLTGLPMHAVTDDASPRGRVSLALWEPPLTSFEGENGAPVRRSASSETADLLADLVSSDVRTLAFVRSRAGAEQTAMSAARLVAEVDPSLPGKIAAYRVNMKVTFVLK